MNDTNASLRFCWKPLRNEFTTSAEQPAFVRNTPKKNLRFILSPHAYSLKGGEFFAKTNNSAATSLIIVMHGGSAMLKCENWLSWNSTGITSFITCCRNTLRTYALPEMDNDSPPPGSAHSERTRQLPACDSPRRTACSP